MGVDAGRRAQHPGMAAGQVNRPVRVVERAAGDDERRDARSARPFEHAVTFEQILSRGLGHPQVLRHDINELGIAKSGIRWVHTGRQHRRK